MNWHALKQRWRQKRPRRARRTFLLNYLSAAVAGAAPLAKVGSRQTLLNGLGWVIAGASTLVALALVLVWGASVANPTMISIPAGSTELEIGSMDGVVIVGVFDTSPTIWGRPRRTVGIARLQPDPNSDVLGFAATGNLYGWAVSVPHLFLVAIALTVPAWWVLIFRNRNEADVRREQGLCRHCGYDLRESPEMCPECGAPVHRAPAMLQRPTTTPARA